MLQANLTKKTMQICMIKAFAAIVRVPNTCSNISGSFAIQNCTKMFSENFVVCKIY